MQRSDPLLDIQVHHHRGVLPMRPAGTEGWSEDELIRLVTRDSMVGVAPALAAESAA